VEWLLFALFHRMNFALVTLRVGSREKLFSAMKIGKTAVSVVLYF